MTKLYDIHSHVLFDMDDGADNISESIELLKLMVKEGVTNVFCTSHDPFTAIEYNERFEALERAIQKEGLEIKIHKGCEVYCDYAFVDTTIEEIKNGEVLSLGNNHYLVEFHPYESKENILETLKKIINETGANLILAHTERCLNLCPDSKALKTLEDCGVKFQINLYSLADESNPLIKNFARTLLLFRKVSFVGSDSHRITHRPPILKRGIEYIKEHCEEEYANNILYGNAENFLL